MGISQSQEFVSSDQSSNSVECVLFLVFYTYLAFASLPDYECGGNFEVEIIAAGKDLYKQAFRSTDSAHFENSYIRVQERSCYLQFRDKMRKRQFCSPDGRNA